MKEQQLRPAPTLPPTPMNSHGCSGEQRGGERRVRRGAMPERRVRAQRDRRQSRSQIVSRWRGVAGLASAVVSIFPRMCLYL